MKVSTRRGVIAAAAALALTLTACGGGGDDGGGSGSQEAQEGGAVTINGCTPQNPLIPVATNETCGGNPIDSMFTGLTTVDPETSKPVNAVAESIETKDNKTFKITLKDWKFHDGTEVKAENFVKAWNWGARKENAALALNAPFFGQLGIKGFDQVAAGKAQNMSGLKVTGDKTFTVELEAENTLFSHFVVYSAFYPLPDSFFKDPKAFGKKPVGNGPFEFVSYTPDQSIKEKKFADYAGKESPHVDELTWKIYPDTEAAYADVVAGNIDYLDEVPPSAIAGDAWKQDLKGRHLEEPSTVWNGYAFPLYDKRFQDPTLRIAISQAIDRQAVSDAVYGGSNEPATAWSAPGIDGYIEGVCGDACKYDPEAAKAKLKEAGGFDDTLTISYNADGAGNKEAADAVCASIRKTLEIKCQSNRYAQFAQLRNDATADKMSGLFRNGWQVDYPSAQTYLAPINQTNGSANDSGFSNKRFDELMNKLNTTDPDKAKPIYEEAEKILAKEMPVIPLWYNTTRFGWSQKVVEPRVTYKGTIDPASVGLKK